MAFPRLCVYWQKRTQGTIILNHLKLACVYLWQTATEAFTIFISTVEISCQQRWLCIPVKQFNEQSQGFSKDAFYFLPKIVPLCLNSKLPPSAGTNTGLVVAVQHMESPTNPIHQHLLNTCYSQVLSQTLQMKHILSLSAKANALLRALHYRCRSLLDLNMQTISLFIHSRAKNNLLMLLWLRTRATPSLGKVFLLAITVSLYEHRKLESLLKPLTVFKRPINWRLCVSPPSFNPLWRYFSRPDSGDK